MMCLWFKFVYIGEKWLIWKKFGVKIVNEVDVRILGFIVFIFNVIDDGF